MPGLPPNNDAPIFQKQVRSDYKEKANDTFGYPSAIAISPITMSHTATTPKTRDAYFLRSSLSRVSSANSRFSRSLSSD